MDILSLEVDHPLETLPIPRIVHVRLVLIAFPFKRYGSVSFVPTVYLNKAEEKLCHIKQIETHN